MSDASARVIILASASPRRHALLEQLGFEPKIVISDVEEERKKDEHPQLYTERLAREKARNVAVKLEGEADKMPEWILAADTIVVQGVQVLEKPKDEQDACAMLRMLSDSSHHVITSFCWWHRPTQGGIVRSVQTAVRFRPLDEDTITRYVRTGEPMDKAGAYGIQGLGGALVESIEGSYTCVVGLPIAEVVVALKELGGLKGFPFAPTMSHGC